MATGATLRVLGIPGSLRARSYNRALLRAAQELGPKACRSRCATWPRSPVYNEDVEAQGVPGTRRRVQDGAGARPMRCCTLATSNTTTAPGVLRTHRLGHASAGRVALAASRPASWGPPMAWAAPSRHNSALGQVCSSRDPGAAATRGAVARAPGQFDAQGPADGRATRVQMANAPQRSRSGPRACGYDRRSSRSESSARQPRQRPGLLDPSPKRCIGRSKRRRQS